MILPIHIVLAILSIILSSLLLFRPTQKKLNSTFVLFCGTFITGTIMILTMQVNMLVTCIEGLLYMGFVLGAIVVARKKLTREHTS